MPTRVQHSDSVCNGPFTTYGCAYEIREGKSRLGTCPASSTAFSASMIPGKGRTRARGWGWPSPAALSARIRARSAPLQATAPPPLRLPCPLIVSWKPRHEVPAPRHWRRAGYPLGLHHLQLLPRTGKARRTPLLPHPPLPGIGRQAPAHRIAPHASVNAVHRRHQRPAALAVAGIQPVQLPLFHPAQGHERLRFP